MNSTALSHGTFILPVSLFLAGCANPPVHTSDGTAAGSTSPPDVLTFYSVPFTCPAAPEIGCGSLAKPILLELERVSGIKEAWLNRAGTQLAIVWSESGSSEMR